MPEPGRLLVCATPIGNLADVTLRVLDALKSADVIEAEDTRVTRKLLSRYDIHTPLEPYHARNLEARTPAVISRIERGQTIALVSDAGTPGISDPGERLVDACLEAGLRVEVLPGPSAIISALVSSGLPTHTFYFGGFLPRRPGPMKRALAAIAGLDATLVFYESPRRAAATMRVISEALPGRRAAFARELTKLHEEVGRDTVENLAASLGGRELKGEVVLLIGPAPRSFAAGGSPDLASSREVREAVASLVASGLTKAEAIRRVAAETGLGRNKVYRIVLGGD